MTEVMTRPNAAPSPAAGVRAMPEPPSILVLTKDEEVNIASCLQSLAFSDDIVVLDSFSSDKTCEIAASFPNVRIIQRKFDTWSRHSNWALENIPFKHPWVYYSDADEHVTPELRDEIVRKINDPAYTYSAYRLRYKNMFMGRWLRWGGVYPVWIIRLFRPDKVRYEDREVNAHPLVNGSLGDLDEHFIHYSFNKGLVPWLQKHNSYSQMEAHEAIRVRRTRFWGQVKAVIRPGDRGLRRRALKNLSFYLPARGLARFVYMYFLKLGFLNGMAGFHYAAMISMYEYWITLKAVETKANWRERTNVRVAQILAEAQK
jgi:glycosyltransferase involved in cell wall biosynthesis